LIVLSDKIAGQHMKSTLYARTGKLIIRAAAVSLVCLAALPAAGQARRAANGKPDLNGIWQALNTAAWDIQDHSGQLGVPPGQGIVEGNEIPYQPWAAAKKQENLASRKTVDQTEANCFMPGVPRATYMPFPFEIVQTPKTVALAYEFAHALRSIPMDGSPTRADDGKAIRWWST
jgi:hypothetical protein